MSVAMLASASASALAAHLPYFHLGAIDTGVVPIQAFGILVAAGVLIGASLLRRYAEWHGISDEDIRGLTAWVTVSGFIGAHVFDVLFYQWAKLTDSLSPGYVGPILLVKVWDGISSYGGFVGGAIGFAIYVWWKRLPARLMADITIVGLLPAFSIGRIGCTVVSDHIGSMVDSAKWYAALAIDYPVEFAKDNTGNFIRDGFHRGDWALTNTLPQVDDLVHQAGLAKTTLTDHIDHLTAWNLGLIEFLWLVPINILVLWLAFRTPKRPNAGFLVVITGVLYAPVRFFLDFLRPEATDPRYLGLTFAQWISIVAFAVAAYVAYLVARTGKPAKTIAPTSREAQERLKVILRDAEEEEKKEAKDADDAEAPKAGAKKKRKAAAAKAADDDADDEDKKAGKAAPPEAAAPVPPTLGPDD